jgi:ribosomal protein S20
VFSYNAGTFHSLSLFLFPKRLQKIIYFYYMPVTKSAEKAMRQSLKKRSRNKHFLALYRESLKSFEKALTTGVEAANGALADLQSKVDTLVKKNVLHKNTAARKKSSFAKMIAKLGSTGVVTAAPAKAKKATVTKAKAPAAEKVEKAPAKKPAAAKKPAVKKATSKSAE